MGNKCSEANCCTQQMNTGFGCSYLTDNDCNKAPTLFKSNQSHSFDHQAKNALGEKNSSQMLNCGGLNDENINRSNFQRNKNKFQISGVNTIQESETYYAQQKPNKSTWHSYASGSKPGSKTNSQVLGGQSQSNFGQGGVNYSSIQRISQLTSSQLKKYPPDVQSALLQIQATLNQNKRVKLGPLKLPNGSTYDGEYYRGVKDGYGTLVYADGSKYIGEWKNDSANGKGKWLNNRGDVYEGELVNDKANGYGKYTYANGFTYEGEWVDDKFHGKGKETWVDGTIVVCTYTHGNKEGKGEIKFVDGSFYKGDFKNDAITGLGCFKYADGKQYQGTFVDGMMHGSGVTTWPDGRRYQGSYKNNKKHDYGEFRYQDGKVYRGEWKNGRQHGKGEIIHVGGRSVKGNWNDGKMSESSMQ